MACDINQSNETLDLLEGAHLYWTQKCHVHIRCVGMYGEDGASRGDLEIGQVRGSSRISPQFESCAVDANPSAPAQNLESFRRYGRKLQMTTNPALSPKLGPLVIGIVTGSGVGVTLEVRGANGQRKGCWEEGGANKRRTGEANNQKKGG